MPGLLTQLENADRLLEARRRRRSLIGLFCLVLAWTAIRLTPLETRKAVLSAWGNFPSGIYQAWRARNPRTDATALITGNFNTTEDKRTRRRRSQRRKRAKRPQLMAPEHMRDALRDEPRGPLSWEGIQKTKPRPEPKTRRSRTKGKKAPRPPAPAAARRPAPAKVKAPAARKPAAAATHTRPAKAAASRKTAPARARPAPPAQTPRPDFDGRTARTKPGMKLAYALPNSSIGKLPDFYKPAAAKRPPAKTQPKAEKPPKPPTLAKLIGTGALTPPAAKAGRKAPSFGKLRDSFPPALPDGKDYNRKTPPPAHVETVAPPDEHELYDRWLEIDENKQRKKDEAHWHGDGESILYMHFDKVWASPKDRRWSWIVKSGTAWWTIADGAQRMIRHKDLWWWKTEFGWFPLKDGKPLAADFAADWKRGGLLQKGWSLKFSKDLSRAAVATPGAGTTVFDARTGQYLDRLPEKDKLDP